MSKAQAHQAQRILSEQIAILFSRAQVVYLVNILVSVATVAVLWNVAPKTALLSWCSIVVIFTLARFHYLRVYRANGRERIEFWRRLAIAFSAFSGLLWGGLGMVFFPENQPVYQAYLLLVVSGMLAGAVSSWSVYMPAFRAFFVPASLFMLLRLFIAMLEGGNRTLFALAILFAGFSAALYSFAKNANKVLHDSLNAQFEKLAIAKTLEEKRREAEYSEERLKKAHRALQAISECNETMVRANLESELLHDFCSILVKRGGYRLAWVGYARQDGMKDISPIARAGFDEGYLESQRFSWDEGQWGGGPEGLAIRAGSPVALNNLQFDPRFKPWRKEALKRGYASMISLPLRMGGAVSGVLSVYASEQNAFDAAEMELLLQLSEDLAYGIKSLRTRAEIAKQAWHDSLTGLPNRSLLGDRMRQAMAHAKRTERILAVLFLDLDGFKQINDQYGHASGDELIREIAARLVNSVRAEDTVARLGGDEFVILLDIGSQEEMEQCIDRIMMEVKNPVAMDGRAVSVSASIGITLFPQNEADADALLRHADMAMYQSKQAGRDCYRIFDVNMDQSARLNFQMRERIAQAIEARGFRLHYQPKVNLRTGQMFGVEALIRWDHPEKGLLPPLDFLPFAENSELIIRLGDWVLDEALRQLSAWKKEGIDIGVSVNVASEQLHEPNFCRKLREAISRYGNLHPSCLELEILESTALQDIQLVKKVLNDCKALGVMLSLDDFGTGYSSLAYLRHLPVDTLKIDQSFVRDMIDDREDLATIEGVISLARIFKRDLIAEGVETKEHGSLLLQMGCERGQGYGIARPMPAEEIPGWMESRQPSG